MKWLGIIVATLVGLYGAYAILYPTYSYRFRITIEVDTAEGVKTGSSVVEVRTIQYPSWITLGTNNYQTTVRGEAVFVDLGKSRNLIALLALNPHAQDGRATLFAPRSFFANVENSLNDVKWSKELSAMTGRREFAGDRRPTLVTFSDLRDPSTVQEVPFDDPQSVLGSDVRSVRAWVDLTKGPVTTNLETKLPWIGRFESARIAQRIVTRGRPNSAAPLEMFRRQ